MANRNKISRRGDGRVARVAHHKNGETFTVANGVVAPVALPGCALKPLEPAAVAADMVLVGASREGRARVCVRRERTRRENFIE